MEDFDTTRQMEDTAEEARMQAYNLADKAEEQAGHAGGRMREYAHQGADRAKQEARNLAEQARQQLNQAKSQIKDRGVSMVQEQRGKAAEKISGLGESIRCTANGLREGPGAPVAQYIDTFASQFDSAASYVRDRDLSALADDVQRFARQRPELVLGTAFFAGLAIARFLKAASRSSGSDIYGDANVAGYGYSGYSSEMEGDRYGTAAFTQTNPDLNRDSFDDDTPPADVELTFGGGISGTAGGLAGGLQHLPHDDIAGGANSTVPPSTDAVVSSGTDADITGSSDIGDRMDESTGTGTQGMSCPPGNQA